MKKAKLTQAQVDAVAKALDHYNGDADYLLVCHRNLMADGCEWELWPELNELNTSQLRQVLKGSYDVVTMPVQYASRGEAMSKQFIKIVRSTDINKQRQRLLLLDIDYQLASLHDALQRDDEREVARCKALLVELQEELSE